MPMVARRVAGLLCAALFVVGCGVPTDEEASAIDLEELPEGLRPGFTPTTSTTPPTPALETYTVFLLNNPPDTERTVVVGVERQLSEAGRLNDVLAALFGQATSADEQAAGFFNTLELFEMNSVTVADDVATVDIASQSPEEIPSADTLRLAAAQLVFTITEWGADGARILLDGAEVSIPTSDDDAEPGTVLRISAYEQFQPDFVATVTTTSLP